MDNEEERAEHESVIPKILKLILLTAITLAFTAPCGWPQSAKTDGNCTALTVAPPRFEDFPVSVEFRSKPARVDLSSHPEARTFRTKLREGAKEGPNFAGHYTVVSWHCGTECQAVAIVDAKTGRVYFAPFSTSEGSEFRIDSALFIANSPEAIKRRKQDPMTDPEWCRDSYYYRWENSHFVLIYPKKESSE